MCRNSQAQMSVRLRRRQQSRPEHRALLNCPASWGSPSTELPGGQPTSPAVCSGIRRGPWSQAVAAGGGRGGEGKASNCREEAAQRRWGQLRPRNHARPHLRGSHARPPGPPCLFGGKNGKSKMRSQGANAKTTTFHRWDAPLERQNKHRASLGENTVFIIGQIFFLHSPGIKNLLKIAVNCAVPSKVRVCTSGMHPCYIIGCSVKCVQ